MTAVKGHQVIIPVYKIQCPRVCFFHIDPFISPISNHSASCDNIVLGQDAVIKRYGQAGYRILQINLEGLCLIFFPIHCRQPLQTIFSVIDLMRFIAKITSISLVFIPDDKSSAPKVPTAHKWKFLRQSIQGIGPVLSCIIGISGKSPIHIRQKIIHRSFGLFSII